MQGWLVAAHAAILKLHPGSIPDPGLPHRHRQFAQARHADGKVTPLTMPTATIRLRSTAVERTMLVAVLGPVLGCGGDPAIVRSSPGTVVIKNFTFTPTPLTVAPGTKMMINQDQAPHTVAANDKSFR